MTTEELLRAGIAAAKAGDAAQASKLLIQVVQSDPNSELGWLWLGFCRTVPEQREYCFRRVLAINPQNADARRQLGAPNAPAIQPAPPISHAANVPASDSVEPLKAREPVSPKIGTPQPVKKTAPPKARRKSNSTLIWAGAAFGLCACIAVAGMVVFWGIWNVRNAPAPVPPSPTVVPVTPTPSYVPVFQSAPCNFRTPDKARVDCGFVIVPEDRSGDLLDTIRLAVIIYRSTSGASLPDPLIYLSGGPGGEAISWSVDAYESVIAPLAGTRDFIVFDPRGVGRSEPALSCDDFGKTYLQDLQGKIPGDQRVSYYEGALLGCKNHLKELGANLSAYTSVDMAADVRDVIVALGYRQANLYGVSYGTRVGQFVMRSYPQVVRTAILDSVVPVEVQMFNQSSTGTNDILQVLFQDCKADPTCSTAYPDLEAAYQETFDHLNSDPAHVSLTLPDGSKMEETINGATFSNAVLWALRTPQTIPLAPQLIYRVRDGDTSLLIVSLALPIMAFDSISMGSYISVNCHDQVFAMSMEGLDETIQDMCRLWEARPLAAGENDPVSSDIPTLIFAGRYDPTTPPAFARQLAGHLGHSYIAEIPNQGHAPSATGVSDCPGTIISAFLQDPNVAPDFACIQETGKIEFFPPYKASNAPITLEPVTIDQYQLNTRVPSGWTPANYGFYNRLGFWGDLTQVGIQAAPTSEADWLTWLSTNFRGNQGFDQTPVKQGERQANGLTWSLYKTSSQSTLVDVAFAKSGSQTLLVILVSYADEHDALYNSVFLPAIDATIPAQ
jgi:pimeloyl-ACP methyl ester carboxylesterase